MTLVDTNVVLDLLGPDSLWRSWSESRWQQRLTIGPVAINDVIFSEESVGFQSGEKAAAAIESLGMLHLPFDHSTLHQAAQTFRAYRARGGTRTSVLPDFFIGAQARTLGCPVLTRDVGRYRTYYPDVPLITPA